ncbi:RDD family protein [soil metagenome]
MSPSMPSSDPANATASLSETPHGAAEAAAPSPAPGLWRRMACWLYEGMLMFAVMFVAGWLFSTLGQMRDAMDERRHLLQAFLFVVFGVYFVWFWIHGQTLAMKTWGIRIVDAAGRPVTQRRALVRYLLSWIWFLPPLAAIAPFKLSGGESALLIFGWVLVWALLSRFHPQRQFWHDAWAGTRLVSSRPMSRS